MNDDGGSKVTVGGQAVIEGVMMRSPHAVSVAVRKNQNEIVVKKDSYLSLPSRYKILNLPIVRGAIILFETIILGIKALTFSGDVALEEENKKNNPTGTDKEKKPQTLSGFRLGLLVLFSLAIGLLLFFYLPLVLTELIGVKSGFWFNLIDGGFRLAIFLLYIFGITMIKDIRRIFEYHGAEHKSIFTYEKGLELTVPNTQNFSTHHPKCGTSFLLIVVVVSVLVFLFLGRPETVGERLFRLLFVPVIGGLSYELIRLSGKFSNSPIGTWLVAPGLWLQRITTKEPDASQLEVAIAALKSSLSHDYSEQIQTLQTE